MMQRTSKQENKYEKPFIIQDTTLELICNFVMDEFQKNGFKCLENHSIGLADGSNYDGLSFKSLAEIDNAIKNPISRATLDIQGIRQEDSSDKYPYIRVQITFRPTDPEILLTVTSDDSHFPQVLYSQLRGRIDRIHRESQSHWRTIANSIRIISFISVILLWFLAMARMSPSPSVFSLAPETVRQLVELSEKATDSGSMAKFSLQFQRALLYEASGVRYDVKQEKPLTKPEDGTKNSIVRLVVWGIFAMIFLISAHVIGEGYPQGVLCWGEMEGRYRRLVNSRTVAWGVLLVEIVLPFIVGIVSADISRFLGIT